MSNWILNTFSPSCSVLSKLMIRKIETSDPAYYKVHIKGYSNPIIIEKSIGLHAVHHVIAEQLYKWHWHFYEIPETKVLDGEIVFDCGCAEGIFCLLTYNRARVVYAFEPLPEYVTGLNETFKSIANVEIINAALGDRVGKTYFNKGGIASSISEIKTDYVVNINTIDNFCIENSTEVNYIKADIEGYELQLLLGAQESIRNFKPKIAITVYHEQNNVNEIKELLTTLVTDYKFKVKGITDSPTNPVMLHAWA